MEVAWREARLLGRKRKFAASTLSFTPCTCLSQLLLLSLIFSYITMHEHDEEKTPTVEDFRIRAMATACGVATYDLEYAHEKQSTHPSALTTEFIGTAVASQRPARSRVR